MSVFVLDQRKRPLMPCIEKRARKLLDSGRARVHKLYPFAIRPIDRRVEDCVLQPMRLSLDPGSKITGVALARIEAKVDVVSGEISEPVMHIAFLMDLVHRGLQISKALSARAALRRGRRSRNTRYLQPRFDNRTKPEGWLAPSLQHRMLTTMTWVRRLRALAPVTQLAQELVRFDMQEMQAAESGQTIEGVEYQRGTLASYEVGEYLLAKWSRTCAYCDAQNVPFEKDHILARSKGGSNRVSNLCLACRPCNLAKANLDVRVFLQKQPDRLTRILATAKAPLRDAAAVNSTRWALLNALKALGLAVETGSGGRTKFNRTRLGIPKSHALDAACVGVVGDVRRPAQTTLTVKCTGRGARQRTRVDACGFPRGYLMRAKSVRGFRTGDMVKANVPASSKRVGEYAGRVAIRASGSFNIQTAKGVVQGISHKHCRIIQRSDGYGYSTVANTDATGSPPKPRNAAHSALSLPALKDRVSRAIQG
jgi:5-methylcytosine-specific restriction endonuclease McrA